MPRGVYERKPRPVTPYSLRSLRVGEAIPAGTPRRYRDAAGYVILRWKVGVRSYVEAKEHRIIAGHYAGKHVHHKNHVRDDNRPENLVVLDPEDHGRHHANHRRKVDIEAAIALYEAGYATTEIGRIQGVNHSNVWRSLNRVGYRMRKPSVGRKVAMDRRASA